MPLEQLSNNLDFFSFYVASKQAVTGLTVSVDVWKHLTSTNASSQIVTAGSATEVGGGLYRYQLSSASVTGEGEYICIFKTTSTTPDQQHIPSIWCVQKAGSEYLDAAVTTRASATDYTSTRAGYLDRLDATISSRQASGNVTVAGYASGQDPATLVWAASTRTLSGFGFSVTVGTNNDKTGYALAVTPPTAQQIWDTLTSALTTAGSVGKRIADNLDAAVSSRLPTSSYTAPSSITSLQADVTSIKSTVTTNLDVTTSSRQASGNVTIAGYAAGQDPVTLTGVTTTRAAKLDNLDTTVSSRFAPAGLTSLQADVTAIKTPVVANIDATISSRLPTSSYSSPASITSLQADVTSIKSTVTTNLDTTVSSRFPTSSWIPPVTASGSISYPVTVTQSDGVTPIEGVQVWITTDLAGTNVIAGSLYTSSMGIATFVLDAGSYYLWRQISGWNFSNPQAITVS